MMRSLIRRTKNFLHKVESVIANTYYGNPSCGMTIIGVTGTDGKTTTTSLIYHILRENHKKVAMISSVGAYIGRKIYDVGFHVTTPSSFALQKYIKKAFDMGTEYLILEVTSHALDQARVGGISFDIGVVTNVTNEHLDYHKSYQEYVNTKSKLLKMAKIGVINKDDRSYDYLISNFSINKSGLRKTGKTENSKLKIQKIITYGMDKNSDVNICNFPFKTNLIGKFNKYNILASVAVCKQLGLQDEKIRQAIASFAAPIGRQEIVYDGDFVIMVDFAHTPNAFQKILPEVKRITKGRLIHVFGSAGQRDKIKRPEMGKISAKFSDLIILTGEDPRSESVESITEEILNGIDKSSFEISDRNRQLSSVIKKNKKYLFKIPDRKKAIRFAVYLAKKGDTVLLTGKGHEKSINYGNGEEEWNEKQVAMNALKSRLNK